MLCLKMRNKFRKNKHIVMFLQTLDNYKSLIILRIIFIINKMHILRINKNL